MSGIALRDIHSPLCPPEVRFDAVPSGVPITIPTTEGIFKWPDARQLLGASGIAGIITPYIGSGVATGYTWRSHAYNVELTFSGVVSSVPSGIGITSLSWDFGDGTTAVGITPKHTYKVVVPSMIATLGVGFSDGTYVFVPKQMMLVASGETIPLPPPTPPPPASGVAPHMTGIPSVSSPGSFMLTVS